MNNNNNETNAVEFDRIKDFLKKKSIDACPNYNLLKIAEDIKNN